MYKQFFKRFLDILGAILIILVLLPVFLVLIIFLSFYYKGSPFFTQRRPGKNNQIFEVIKFKSMIDAFDAQGNALPNKDRITNVGRFLRRTSLDEIPQIFNILKGEMSFVGPRPLFESYLEYYTVLELTRHSVRPGVTGLAQVNGRNFLNWDERLALDVVYAKDVKLTSDLKILYMTFIKVLKSQDISVVPSMTPLYKIREKRKS